MNYDDTNASNLMPQALFDTLPDLYTQEDVADPIVHAKYFTPDAGATWLIIEADKNTKPEDAYMLCFACLGPHMLDCAEPGYVTMRELTELRGPLGLRVERDLYWTPVPLSVAKKWEFGL